MMSPMALKIAVNCAYATAASLSGSMPKAPALAAVGLASQNAAMPMSMSAEIRLAHTPIRMRFDGWRSGFVMRGFMEWRAERGPRDRGEA